MEDAYAKAVAQGLVIADSLDDLSDDEFKLQTAARPPGYCAQTVLHFGRLGVTTLLDYGATCNAMPEEVALSIMSHAVDSFPDREDVRYPIVRLHKYSTARTIDGVAAGKPIQIKYAVVLRAEFVGVGRTERGHSGTSTSRVCPKGHAAFRGA